jgi:hypothetical protein
VVNPADAERARGFIDEYLNASSGPARKCEKCGEENPGAFEVCWNCREPLPA